MSTTQTNEPIERWWFTFGGGHTHPETGEDLSRAYVVLEGTWADSRAAMFASAFGNRWSHHYESAELAGVERFGLHEVAMPAPLPPVESKIWACPEADCGYHIADGPVADGEESTDDLISEHLAEHAALATLTDPATGPALDRVVLGAEVAPEPETERAAFTRGLREVAAWLDAHPEVPLPYIDKVMTGKFRPTFSVYIGTWSGDQREQLAAVGRAMGRFDKFAKPDDDHFVVYRQFGGITFAAQADREEVCTKVVTGTREVTEEVPDPEALAAVPKVTVTKTVEDVEWICSSLLAPEAPAEEAV